MKLVTFVCGEERIGFVVENLVVDLTLAYAAMLKAAGEPKPLRIAYAKIPLDMMEFLEREEKAIEDAMKCEEFVRERIETGKSLEIGGEKYVYRIDEVKLKAPIPRPRYIVDFSTFEAHVKMSFEKLGLQIPEEWYRIPVGYKVNPYSVVGTDEPIYWPKFAQILDYEIELGICIGKKGKNVSKEKAYDHVLGYTVVNDVSARDTEWLELKAMPLGPLKSKDFDSATVMGPWIVTKDEIKDPHNLKMVARVNGEIWSEANTKDMYWKIPDLVHNLSQDQTLYPGMFLLSGTPGMGCGLHVGKFLKAGDLVELEIDNIGKIRNWMVRDA